MEKAIESDKYPDINLSPDGLSDILFHLLRTFYQFESIEVNTFGLSYDLIYILKLLKRTESMRISDIGEEMKIKIFTATRLIDQLEKKLFVKRERAGTDKRNVMVAITPAGRKMAKKLESHALQLILKNMSDYTETEMILLLNTIKKIDRILGIEPGRFIYKK